MEVRENYSYLRNRLILGLQNFISVTIAYLVLFMLVRLFEFGILYFTHSALTRLYYYELMALRYDFFYFINLSSYLFLPIVLLSIILDFRVINFLYSLILAFAVLIYTLLVYYFSLTLNPLGVDFLAYSEDELKLVIGASGAINWITILIAMVIIVLCIRVPFYFKKINWRYTFLFVYLLVAVLTWVFPTLFQPNINSFSKDINYNLTVNKFAYLIDDFSENEIRKKDIVYDGFYFDDDLTGKSFKYIDPEHYPFLNRDTIPDVLKNYFNKFQSTPNIVFIIVESLGSSYSGKNAELGSFTPFLDSLADKGLYWKNFLSNGGRTFAALPALFGSLPFAEKGFMDLQNKMPKHQSLIRILKANGYSTNFYHGGDAKFDDMDLFLTNQNIDRIVDIKNFPSNYTKMPSNNQGFTWGYGDIEMFNYYFKIPQIPNKPRLDIFLTLSNHSPFKVLNQSKYQKLFTERLDELNIQGEGREAYQSYESMYNTIMYSDDAIRKFINDFKKLPEYNNTIFIITGDHRMPEIPVDERIDHFRVPLIVFSPNIKNSAVFKGVCSHLDVTPSLIAFLRVNYKIQRPAEQSWLGSNLDTSRFFRSSKFIPMMRNKNELLDFIDRENYFADKRVLVLNDKFKTSNADDLVSRRISEGRIKEFKEKNSMVSKLTSLIPDSVYYFTPR